MTLEQFRTLFGRAAAPLDTAASGDPRGDHDLNPGFDLRPEARPAAVLVPVVDRPDGATILLTRRSDDLPVHAGQVSFPGGRAEASDRDPVHTALRESEEEIGLDPGAVTVLGRMDTYLTGTGRGGAGGRSAQPAARPDTRPARSGRDFRSAVSSRLRPPKPSPGKRDVEGQAAALLCYAV